MQQIFENKNFCENSLVFIFYENFIQQTSLTFNKKVAVKNIDKQQTNNISQSKSILMFIAKKSCPRNDSIRYSSKKNDNQISFVFTHRPNESNVKNQSSNTSLRKSGQKVLKLRGNSKNSGIKLASQQNKNERLSNNHRHSNLQNSKRNQEIFNSKESLSSTLHFHQNIESQTKPSSTSRQNQPSLNFNFNVSYLKANKQNMIDSGRELQRKRSAQKGLVLTKKNSVQNSYLIEGYESCHKNNSTIKPKSARVDKPLTQNYLILNLNQFQSKQKQGQKRSKLSIDFDSFLNQNRNQILHNQQNERSNDFFNQVKKEQKVIKKQPLIDNFYSQRNSVSNIYQTGNLSKQSSRQKITIKQKYGGMKIEKKLQRVFQNNKQKNSQINQLLRSIDDRNQKQSACFNMSKEKVNIKDSKQPIKSQRQNNYIEQTFNSNASNKHQRILSILEKGSNFNHQETKYHKKSSQNNYPSISTQQTYQSLSKQKKKLNQIVKYSPNSFNYDYVVGKGGFGKVWKVHCKRTDGVFALKQMSKALIISKKSVPSVMNQQQLLKDLKNPFLVNMVQSFQTRQNLYLLMDYLSGGDLRHHLAVKKYFTEDQTKFMVICILLGLKYLHENQIIHRDIKPENIVLDQKGYARITDLGVARKWRDNNSCDTSGTPGYMAPQVLCRQNHSFEADYFAVGVITYEMMLRKRPYYGRSRKQIRDQVLAKQVQVKKQDIPDGWSLQCADFINRMIQRKPSNRLGYNGIGEILNHPWLKNTPIQRVQQKKIYSPYIPQKFSQGQSQCMDYTSSQDTEIKELIAQNQIMLRQKDVQNLFSGYEHF